MWGESMAGVLGWLLVPVIFSLLSDWPWLLGLFVFQWTLEYAYGHFAMVPFVLELLFVGVVEGLLAWYLPPKAVDRSSKRLLVEGSVLVWFAVLFGAILGFGIWQVAVGFDAGVRLHSAVREIKRRATLRGVRFFVGLLLMIFSIGWYIR